MKRGRKGKLGGRAKLRGGRKGWREIARQPVKKEKKNLLACLAMKGRYLLFSASETKKFFLFAAATGRSRNGHKTKEQKQKCLG